MSQESDGMPSAKRRKEAASQSKSRHTQASQSSQTEGPEYRKGSIIRLTMKDFVTYSQAEIRPGPQLNVVIGPNGTGKSTLVCAMVLGLGGKPAVLGRAKEPRDFIKHGMDTAIVETELYGGPGSHQNYIIRRKIFNDNTSTWKLNGRDSTQKEVLAFVKKLNVQVENLCQFLPQDRVASFAAMDNMQLLTETQMAINDELAEQHKELIALKKEEVESRTTFDTQARVLDELKKANDALKRDVMRFQERQRLLEKLEQLESKRPWVAFEASRLAAIALQEAYKQAEASLKEAEQAIAPLEAAAQEKAAAVEAGAGEEKELTTKARTYTTQRQQIIEKLKTLSEKTTAMEMKLTALDNSEERRLAKVQGLTRAIAEMKTKIEKAEEAETERLENVSRLKVELEEAKHAEKESQQAVVLASQRLPGLDAKRRELAQKMKELHAAENAKLDFYRSDRDASGSFKVFTQWVQPDGSMHKHLQGAVYGPISLILTCTDKVATQWMDKMLNFNQWTGFIAEKQADRDAIIDWCRVQRIKPHPSIIYSASAFQDFNRPLKKGQLAEFGFDGYMDSLFECPPLVKWHLCNIVNLHAIPFDRTGASEKHFDKIKALARGHGQSIRRWVTVTDQYISKPSRYSDNVVVTVEPIKTNKPPKFARVMQPDLRAQVSADLRTVEEEFGAVQAAADEAKKTHQQAKTEVGRVNAEMAKWKSADIASLRARLKEQEREHSELSKGVEAEREGIMKSITASVKSRVQPLFQLRDISPKWVETNLELAAALLQRGILKNAAEIASNAFRAAREASANLRHLAAQSKAEFERAKQQTKVLRDEAQKKAAKTPELEAVWAELPDTIAELDEQIDNHRVRITAISPNPAIMEKYRQREEEINKLEEVLANHDANLKEKQARIDDLRNSWKPEIEKFITEINANFHQYFKEIGCIGEVKLSAEGDDFAHYGIDIWVSYRTTEAAKKLDARVQSGGERSVATMLYLIALQELSDCPFRLVDEINQGMDPHNERMIFDRVSLQASKLNTPQYFLITPKLLPDLKFTPAVTVLCVFNGPFMVDQDKWVVAS